ncbi:MAG: ABC transporter substrate-binding protein [Sphingobacteriales bacterium]|nr:ABC transporter substrate-binding protein [Sphingobacteriales bacterium]
MQIADQTGQTITLPTLAKKIISTVPSQTELLFDLGLDEKVIGITKFCIHPNEWFKTKTRIGGTKTLNIELIRQLNPDIIFANKEENTEEQIKILCKEFPVYISDIKNLDEAIKMIGDIGRITGKENEAAAIVTKIKLGFDKLKPGRKIKTAYLIWQKPYMSAGNDTFINDMMSRCGFKNVLASKLRYPETTIDKLNESGCELLLLSSEPFPFKEQHIDEIRTAGLKGEIKLVDGEMFSWYGSRLLKAPEYFQQLIGSL